MFRRRLIWTSVEEGVVVVDVGVESFVVVERHVVERRLLLRGRYEMTMMYDVLKWRGAG